VNSPIASDLYSVVMMYSSALYKRIMTPLVQLLPQVLQREGMALEVNDDSEVEPPPPGPPTQDFERGDMKRMELVVFLARQRNLA
jgi:hypothetical protein